MIIECQSLTKSYLSDGRVVKAVDDVSLDVEKGDFLVILGHSGSGKTTLLSLIGGLTVPDSGKVFVNSVENWQQNDESLSVMRNSTIGFIFQFASLIPTLTALENVLLPLSFSKNQEGNRESGMELLERVGLRDKINSFPSQLSGGQQRRIAIARAFVNRPEIILADEPTGDLDEETEHEILDIFRRFNEQGVTFVVVTHNSRVADTQARPRVLFMRNGVLSEHKGKQKGQELVRDVV